MAADQSQADAQLNLGRCYEYNIGVIKNERTAMRYYKMAADQGNPAAQFKLGVCNGKGIGVSKKERKAMRYLMMAIDQSYDATKHDMSKARKNKSKK
mmetsp:Transcript_16902/g.29541  ORF Transcript_16902/g.29541 Transcript_16902/m.29541 type:complete len:97 (+) Transcript_16902:45-335(+)